MAKDGSSHSFYFLIFIFALYLFSFLRTKKKREKEEREAEAKKRLTPRPIAQRKKEPPPSLPASTQLKTVSKAQTQKKEVYSAYDQKKGDPRIKKLVKTLPSKKDMVAISEILKPYKPIQ